MSNYLTFEQILQAKDLAEEDVECPEWGGKVRVRGLSVEEATQVSASGGRTINLADGKQLSMTALRVFQLGCVTPKIDANALESLAKKSMAPVFRIVNRIQELSGMSGDNALEALEKNLGETPA